MAARPSYFHFGLFYRTVPKRESQAVLLYMACDLTIKKENVLVLGESTLRNASPEDIWAIVEEFLGSHEADCGQARKDYELQWALDNSGVGRNHPARKGQVTGTLTKEDVMRVGYVYVVKADTANGAAYKIGKTRRTPDERLAEFEPMMPFAATVIWSQPVHNIDKAEKQLQEYYADKRIRGEWFALTAHDLQEIETLLTP